MPEHFEIGIIGGGPGGISAAANAAKHGLSHVLFEKSEIADTIHQYQLRKHVMDEPTKLPLVGDVGFKAGTREEVLDVWNQALEKIKLTSSVRWKSPKLKKPLKDSRCFLATTIAPAIRLF
ncbi:MAG: NAD(P)-binding domain-containing protein [Nitrospinae bacterium]|nr:NAD(P)-binding domain-containing protein [Nitrospinota bacterium]